MSRRRRPAFLLVAVVVEGVPQILTHREWPLHIRRRQNVARDLRRVERRLRRAARRGHIYYDMRTDRVVRKVRR